MKTSQHAYTRKSGSQKETPELIQLSSNIVQVCGYQGYSISPKNFLEIAHVHYLKYQLIRPYLNLYDHNNSMVDIGCSAGAIGLQAIFDGFQYVNFVDHDEEYINIIKSCLRHMRAVDAKTYVSSVSNFSGAFDIGLAFALIHWIYSYSEKMGSLDGAISLLHNISPSTLFIEWVAPNDPAIRDAQHIKQNSEIITGSYTKENFVKALKLRYKIVKKIGDVNTTREMWYASNEPVSPSSGAKILSIIKIFISKIKEKFIRKIKKIKRFI
jgi:hypothetical protein